MYYKLRRLLNDKYIKQDYIKFLSGYGLIGGIPIPCVAGITINKTPTRSRSPKISKAIRKNIQPTTKLDELTTIISEGFASTRCNELNKLLRYSYSTLGVYFSFVGYLDAPSNKLFLAKDPTKLTTIRSQKFFISPKRPIITDVYMRRTSLANSILEMPPISNVELKDFDDFIQMVLSRTRYLNLEIRNIVFKNQQNVQIWLESLISRLGKCYNYHQVLTSPDYYGNMIDGTTDTLNYLIDTLSISFYKLSDVIPVFDNKNANGVAVELVATSSLAPLIDLSNYMFHSVILYNKTRENLFELDGDEIRYFPNFPDFPRGHDGIIIGDRYIQSTYNRFLSTYTPNLQKYKLNGVNSKDNYR